jgi:hypothetical protein
MAKTVLENLEIIEMYRELIRNCTLSWANDGRTKEPSFETDIYFKN